MGKLTKEASNHQQTGVRGTSHAWHSMIEFVEIVFNSHIPSFPWVTR